MAELRIAVGGFLHETHSFAATPTPLADFAQQMWQRGDELLTGLAGSPTGIGGMIDEGRRRGWQIVPTLYTVAMPSGPIVGADYRTIRDTLLDDLRRALPLDGVLLALHGAAVCDDERDPEGDLLQAVRALIGPDVPLVAEFDMHGNLSPASIACCDLLTAYDTNPHTDTYERGVEAAQLLDELLAGRVVPRSAWAAPDLLLAPQATGTADEPLRRLHQRVRELEAQPDVVNISVFAGFAYADTPWTGPLIVVSCNGSTAEVRAAELAGELAAQLEREAAQHGFSQVTPEAAVAAAMQANHGPIILVDSADNIGGGTPGDGTDLLAAMLKAGAQRGVIVLADPAAAAACHRAGVGATLQLTIGAKVDRMHGEPVSVSGRVAALSDGRFVCERSDHHFAARYGINVAMGPSAWLQVDGVSVLLTTDKTPPMDLAMLRHIGIEPELQQMIVVKSAVAYRTAYLPIAGGVIEVDTAGLCTANLRRFPFKHVTRRH
jgi:microcystin degradation protein MlrC